MATHFQSCNVNPIDQAVQTQALPSPPSLNLKPQETSFIRLFITINTNTVYRPYDRMIGVGGRKFTLREENISVLFIYIFIRM